MENPQCPCKWKSCKRRGRCDECIAHHRTHPKHPLPFCQKCGKAPVPASVPGPNRG